MRPSTVLNAMDSSLVEYLREKAALKEYVFNVLDNKHNAFVKNDSSKARRNSSINSITLAFTWDYTTEGHEYWKQLHNDYEDNKPTYYVRTYSTNMDYDGLDIIHRGKSVQTLVILDGSQEVWFKRGGKVDRLHRPDGTLSCTDRTIQVDKEVFMKLKDLISKV